MATSANGNVRITTDIETDGFQESLNRLQSIFSEFADKMENKAKEVSEKTNKNLTNFQKAEQAFDKLSKTGSALGKTFKDLGVAAAGLGTAFAAMVKGAIAGADRVDEMSKRLNISAENFSRLDYAAKQSGTSIEAFGASMRVIAQNVSTQSDVYQRLGVNIKDASGNFKTQEEILLSTIKALQKLPAGTQKSALAMQALGRNSQQLNEILNMTESEFSALMRRSDELGLTIDGKVADAAATLTDRLDDLRMTFSSALRRAITPMIPALEEITNKFIAMLQPGGELSNAFESIADAGLKLVENVLPLLAKLVATLADNINLLVAAFVGYKTAILAARVATILFGTSLSALKIALISTGIGALVVAAGALAAAFISISDTAKDSSEATAKLRAEFTKLDMKGLKNELAGVNEKLAEHNAELEKEKQTLEELEEKRTFWSGNKAAKEQADRVKGIQDLIDIEEKFKQTVEEEIDARKRLETQQKKNNDAIRQTSSSLEPWKKAVDDAKKALEEFMAAAAGGTGKQAFDISKLTKSQKQQFDELKATYDKAKENLESFGKDAEEKTINLGDILARAWSGVVLAFGNGLESFAQTLAEGTAKISDLMGSLASALVDTLSAVGDALIQAGIAELVADTAIGKGNPYGAIAMGLAIKVASGLIKGLLSRSTAGAFADGGIVGGNSYSGDKLTANVNSGEMIINRRQQADLWNFIRSGSGGDGGGASVEIVNNAAVDITTEPAPTGRSMRVMINNQIERYLGSPAGGRLMQRGYGTRQLGRR